MAVRLREVLGEIPVYRPGGCPEERGAASAIKLSSNESPWKPPQQVVDAVARAASTLNRYPDFYKEELVAALAAHLGLAPGQVAVDNGSGTLLQDVVRVVCDAGDEVVLACPTFAAYEIDVLLAGAVPVKVPLDAAYAHDLPVMARAVGPRTRLVLVCNPNNPTGTFLSARELRDFVAGLPGDVLVVVDEAYREFQRVEPARASLALLGEFDNVLLMRTFSKAYGLAGMRVGYCMAHPDVIDAVNKTVAEFSVSSCAQAAALACLEPGVQGALERRAEEIVELRELFQDALGLAGIAYIPSQANFVMLPQAGMAGFNRLARGGVVCRPIDNPEGIRITIGCDRDMQRVAQAMGLRWPAR